MCWRCYCGSSTLCHSSSISSNWLSAHVVMDTAKQCMRHGSVNHHGTNYKLLDFIITELHLQLSNQPKNNSSYVRLSNQRGRRRVPPQLLKACPQTPLEGGVRSTHAPFLTHPPSSQLAPTPLQTLLLMLDQSISHPSSSTSRDSGRLTFLIETVHSPK